MMRAVILGLFAVLSVAAYAQQGPVIITATPNPVPSGGSTAVLTKILAVLPSGTAELTTTETVTPTVDMDYTVSVGREQSTLRILAEAPPVVGSAIWETICNVTGEGTTIASTCPSAANIPNGRGFNWKAPYDAVNHEVMIFGAPASAGSIYSLGLYGLNLSTNTFTARIVQTAATNASSCGQNGPPGSTFNPHGGHPLGFLTFDGARNQLIGQAALCQNANNAYVWRYDATTHAMLSPRPTWLYSPVCDGTFGCPNRFVSWDSGMEYVASVDRTITCCRGNGVALLVTEFNGVTTSNVSGLQRGADGPLCDAGSTQCPPYNHGSALLSEGTTLYLFGGGSCSSPSNDASCPAKYNDLWRYVPQTFTWTKLAPVGGVKPPAVNTVFPWIAYDSKRNRFVFYNGSVLWEYRLASNTWTPIAVTGTGPVMDAYLQLHSDANAATYDPVADAMAVLYSRGQSVSVGVFKLKF